jgi:DNA end-binding protein Ku
LDGVIVLEMLHFDSQLRSLDSVTNEIALPAVSKEELRLANKLIEVSAAKRFDLSAYTDKYTDQLREVIDAKVAGKEVVAPPRDEPAPVINLMDALRKSVAQRGRSAPKQSVRAPRKTTRGKRAVRSRHAG